VRVSFGRRSPLRAPGPLPFVNYNLKKGYYITIQPTIAANWNAPSGNVWLVPFGGAIGRIMRFVRRRPLQSTIANRVEVNVALKGKRVIGPPLVFKQ
jgi:hypothetical protein